MNKNENNTTSDKFIEAMLELIHENGSLTGVNLRMVAKKVGCAHTNAYNYFDGYEGLIYAAYDQALILYALAVVEGLDSIKDRASYFLQFIKNIISFALNYPGYYRFIGSDVFDLSGLHPETIQKAIDLKNFFLQTFYLVTEKNLSKETSDDYANILMSYIDGELYNIINMRSFPDDNTEARIMDNTIKLVQMFTSNNKNSNALYDAGLLDSKPEGPDFLSEIERTKA